MKKEKLKEFKFWIVNMASNKAFEITVKGSDYYDAEAKAKKKFSYPLYKFENE